MDTRTRLCSTRIHLCMYSKFPSTGGKKAHQILGFFTIKKSNPVSLCLCYIIVVNFLGPMGHMI